MLMKLELEFINNSYLSTCRVECSKVGGPHFACKSLTLPVSALKNSFRISTYVTIVVNVKNNTCWINGFKVGFCPIYVAPKIYLNESFLDTYGELEYLGKPIATAYPVQYQSSIGSLTLLGLSNEFMEIEFRGHYVIHANFLIPDKVLLGKALDDLRNRFGVPTKGDLYALVNMMATESTLEKASRVNPNVPPYLTYLELPNGIEVPVVSSNDPITYAKILVVMLAWIAMGLAHIA